MFTLGRHFKEFEHHRHIVLLFVEIFNQILTFITINRFMLLRPAVYWCTHKFPLLLNRTRSIRFLPSDVLHCDYISVFTGQSKYQVNNKTDKYILNILEHNHL
jgi:hypothetical protein